MTTSYAVPMCISAEDQQLLMSRTMARMERELPAKRYTSEDLERCTRAEVDLLVLTGEFAYIDGVFIRKGSDLAAIQAYWDARWAEEDRARLDGSASGERLEP